MDETNVVCNMDAERGCTGEDYTHAIEHKFHPIWCSTDGCERYGIPAFCKDVVR